MRAAVTAMADRTCTYTQHTHAHTRTRMNSTIVIIIFSALIVVAPGRPGKRHDDYIVCGTPKTHLTILRQVRSYNTLVLYLPRMKIKKYPNCIAYAPDGSQYIILYNVLTRKCRR